MLHLPTELHCRIANTLYTADIKSLACVCYTFNDIYTDKYIFDLTGIKLYKHQLEGVKFLLGRESKGLDSILNFDTGVGKTAIILYSYLKNPIPTAIVIHRKHRIIWINEMKKYNIELPIVIIGKKLLSLDLSQYKRFILDEIQEPPHQLTATTASYISKLSHGVIWGLTADTLKIVDGVFSKFHLRHIFGAPDCMITLRYSQLESSIRNKFTLPNFHIVNSVKDIYGLSSYEYECSVIGYIIQLNNHWSTIVGNDLPQYYTEQVRRRIRSYRTYMKSLGLHCIIDEPIEVVMHGKVVDNFDITNPPTCKSVLNNYVQKLVQGKRAIIYADSYGVGGGRDEKFHYHRACEEFIMGNLDIISLTRSYNAGYNFGKIDVIVIDGDHLQYNIFRQILGRINRLDQQNTTDVYIIVSQDHHETNVEQLIHKYKSEFV